MTEVIPDTTQRPADDTPHARPAWTLALACGVMFMVVLDVAVVNVALPSMQISFRVGQASLQWVVIAYGLMLGGFLLAAGRAADLLGRRKILVAGLGLFTVSSLTAGLSGSLGELVASRFAQGLGAAMAAPAALSLLTNAFPEGPPRNRALGMFGAAGGTAAGLGSIVGGVLSEAGGDQVERNPRAVRTGLGLDLLHQCSYRSDADRTQSDPHPGVRVGRRA